MPGLPPNLVEIALMLRIPLKTEKPFQNPAYVFFSDNIKDQPCYVYPFSKGGMDVHIMGSTKVPAAYHPGHP